MAGAGSGVQWGGAGGAEGGAGNGVMSLWDGPGVNEEGSMISESGVTWVNRVGPGACGMDPVASRVYSISPSRQKRG